MNLAKLALKWANFLISLDGKSIEIGEIDVKMAKYPISFGGFRWKVD